MSTFTDIYGNDIDSLEPEDQYRVLLDLPGGDHIAPEVRVRMMRRGETASQALAETRIHPPRNPNSLPRELYGAPSLIDDEHWEGVRDRLRRKGVRLPCDDTFGSRERLVESFDGDETITQTRVATRSRPFINEAGRQEDAGRMATQSQSAVVWELLVQFWGDIWVLVGRCFGRG